MNYWKDFRSAHTDLQLIQLATSLISILLIVRRFVRANGRVKELRAVRGEVI